MLLLNSFFVFVLAVVGCGKRILAHILTLLSFPWTTLPKTASEHLLPYWRFFYASFLKPHTTVSTNGQRDALESFYSSQADAYDVTRARLLKGREDMLALAAAQLKFREGGEDMPKHRIWVDVRAPPPTMPFDQTYPLDWRRDWVQYRSNAPIHRRARLLLSNLSSRFLSLTVQNCSSAIFQARLEERPRYMSRCETLPAAGPRDSHL